MKNPTLSKKYWEAMLTNTTHGFPMEAFEAVVSGEADEASRSIVDQHLKENPDDELIMDGLQLTLNEFGGDVEKMNEYFDDQKRTFQSQIKHIGSVTAIETEDSSDLDDELLEEIFEENAQEAALPSEKSSDAHSSPNHSYYKYSKPPPHPSYAPHASSHIPNKSSITPSKKPIMSNTNSDLITIHDATLIQPLDENEFLHQVLAKRKIASRLTYQKDSYEKDLGVEMDLGFDSFDDVRQTKEMLAWLNRKIGHPKREGAQELVRKFQEEAEGATIKRISPLNNTEELERNYKETDGYLDWKKDLLQNYKGEKREQWEKFFAEDYTLQNELEDQQGRKVLSNRFFFHGLGLGAVYVFSTMFLWRLISDFSMTHLFLAACYMLILSIFPDNWIYELFSSAPENNKNQKHPVRKLFRIRVLLSLVLSLALILTSEGLLWSEYIQYFFEYSPYWIITWILSFSLLHFLPAYRTNTIEVYRKLQETNRRFQVYQRSKQEKYMLKLLEQSDRWQEEHFSEKESKRKQKMESLYDDFLETRKRIYEKQLARLRYLYDLGMGGEEIGPDLYDDYPTEEGQQGTRRSA
ncbi:MAG: hypothetical protein AAF587_19415 [Bacteroidota bacterium]